MGNNNSSSDNAPEKDLPHHLTVSQSFPSTYYVPKSAELDLETAKYDDLIKVRKDLKQALAGLSTNAKNRPYHKCDIEVEVDEDLNLTVKYGDKEAKFSTIYTEDMNSPDYHVFKIGFASGNLTEKELSDYLEVLTYTFVWGIHKLCKTFSTDPKTNFVYLDRNGKEL